MKNYLKISNTLVLLLLSASIVHAKITLPPPSPLQTLTQKVGFADLSISYSRPMSRDRMIFENLVPYGTLWRMGANGATILSSSEAFTIDGHKVPAGDYSLLGIPGESKWTIILNSKTEKFWPPSGYETSNDVLRFEVTPKQTTESYNELGFQFVNLGFDRTSLRMNWETTQVEFELVFDTHAQAIEAIEMQLADAESMKPGDYDQIATYYALWGGDLEKAVSLYDKVIETSKILPYWVMFHKAQLLVKLDRTDEATALATEVIELCKKDPVWGPKYADWAEKLIEEIQ